MVLDRRSEETLAMEESITADVRGLETKLAVRLLGVVSIATGVIIAVYRLWT